MTLSDWATAHPSLVVLVWPLLTAIVTALWQRPSTKQIAAAAGGRHLVLSVWSKCLYLAAAIGIDSRSVIALLKSLLTPKGPPSMSPPPLPSIAIPVFVEEPASNSNAGEPPHAARISLALGITGWVVLLTAMTACGALGGDIKSYSPSPADEASFISYATAEEACALEDAALADRRACVAAVRCAHGRADGGCDGGNAVHDALVTTTFAIDAGADR